MQYCCHFVNIPRSRATIKRQSAVHRHHASQHTCCLVLMTAGILQVISTSAVGLLSEYFSNTYVYAAGPAVASILQQHNCCTILLLFHSSSGYCESHRMPRIVLVVYTVVHTAVFSPNLWNAKLLLLCC